MSDQGGCGDGTSFSAAARKIASTIWGVGRLQFSWSAMAWAVAGVSGV